MRFGFFHASLGFVECVLVFLNEFWGKLTFREGKFTIREGKLTLREGKFTFREGKIALREPSRRQKIPMFFEAFQTVVGFFKPHRVQTTSGNSLLGIWDIVGRAACAGAALRSGAPPHERARRAVGRGMRRITDR